MNQWSMIAFPFKSQKVLKINTDNVYSPQKEINFAVEIDPAPNTK